jgi:hypothetical protein
MPLAYKVLQPEIRGCSSEFTQSAVLVFKKSDIKLVRGAEFLLRIG